MTEKPPNDKKKERLAAQLRANLARRKAQARAKRAGEGDMKPEGPNKGEPQKQGERED